MWLHFISVFTPLVFPSSSVTLSYFIFGLPKRECLHGRTHVHEFRISYNHTEWYLLFPGEIVLAEDKDSPVF